MAIAIVNRIFDSAKIRLPGALDSALLLEFYSLVDDFLRNTNLWKELLPFTATPASDPYVVDPSAYTFTITPPTSSIPILLLGVYDENEVPYHATMPVTSEVVLEQPPSSSRTLYAHVALTIMEPAELDGLSSVPDWIMERYWDMLRDGLIGRMMTQPGKPYSSPQMGLMHLRSYNAKRASARVEAMRQNRYGAQTWHFPQTFNRR